MRVGAAGIGGRPVLVRSLVRSCVHSFVRSFVGSFVRAFVHGVVVERITTDHNGSQRIPFCQRTSLRKRVISVPRPSELPRGSLAMTKFESAVDSQMYWSSSLFFEATRTCRVCVRECVCVSVCVSVCVGV